MNLSVQRDCLLTEGSIVGAIERLSYNRGVWYGHHRARGAGSELALAPVGGW